MVSVLTWSKLEVIVLIWSGGITLILRNLSGRGVSHGMLGLGIPMLHVVKLALLHKAALHPWPAHRAMSVRALHEGARLSLIRAGHGWQRSGSPHAQQPAIAESGHIARVYSSLGSHRAEPMKMSAADLRSALTLRFS